MTPKKYLPTFLLLLTSLAGWAQSTTPAAPAADSTTQLSSIMTIIIIVAAVLIFITSLLVLLRANSFMMKQLLRLEAEKQGIQLPEPTVAAVESQSDVFTWFRKNVWSNAVPLDKEGDITLNHDYDGIRELDNHLPPWWVQLFVVTIFWAGGYMWYYHWGGSGPSQTESYNMDVAAAKKEIAAALAGKANAVDESNATALTDAAALGEGELIFKNSCAACHGQKGEGLVGPNFTDEYWLHGGGIKNVFKTIKYGVPEKGMIAWSSQLKPADIQKVASYILTLKGTNPPNPKAPQGQIWHEDVVVQDTTKTDKG